MGKQTFYKINKPFTNYSLIASRFYQLTQTNSTEMTAANLNTYIQPAEDRVWSKILQADGRWQWDDSNNTDFPIATFTLVSGQQDYAFDPTHLRLIGVSVKNKAGLWSKLLPFDPSDLSTSATDSFVPLQNYGPNMDRAEFLKTAGLPQYYDLLGNSAFLYPPPDNGVSVTLASGGKFYFQRAGKHFDYTTSMFTDSTGSTSSSPGFNSLYHDLIPLWAAYDYCIINIPNLANGYLAEINRKEQQLTLDYSKRDKDERNIMTMKRASYI